MISPDLANISRTGQADFAAATQDAQAADLAPTQTNILDTQVGTAWDGAVWIRADVRVVKGSTASGDSTGTTVTFTIDGVAQPPVPMNLRDGQGQAVLIMASLSPGEHVATAAFSGDDFFAPSSSPQSHVTVTPIRPPGIPTITVLGSSDQLSYVGQAVTFRAGVNVPIDWAATDLGTMTFVIDGVALPPVANTLEMFLLRGTYVGYLGAELTVSTLAVGDHHVVALFSGIPGKLLGSADDFGSEPGEMTQTVRKILTRTTLTAAPNPSFADGRITVTAVVSPFGAPGTPGGMVTFREGTTTLATVPLDADGRAVFTTASLGVGTHVLTAVYQGDANSSPSQATTTQTVDAISGPAPTVVSLQRFGVHRQPTVLVLTFDGPLDPLTAGDARNYRLAGPGGRRFALRFPLQSAVYNPGSHTVTLFTTRPLPLGRTFHLIVVGTDPDGVRGLHGRLLDGKGDGQPGSDYRGAITRASLARIPAHPSRLPIHPHRIPTVVHHPRLTARPARGPAPFRHHAQKIVQATPVIHERATGPVRASRNHHGLHD